VWGRGGVMEWNDKEVGGFISNNNIARTYVIKKKISNNFISDYYDLLF
jgi:hypothetical protein